LTLKKKSTGPRFEHDLVGAIGIELVVTQPARAQPIASSPNAVPIFILSPVYPRCVEPVWGAHFYRRRNAAFWRDAVEATIRLFRAAFALGRSLTQGDHSKPHPREMLYLASKNFKSG
jgi:hypothetical protein